MKLYSNRRGLLIADFVDRYGKHCSIQESSLATECCIWLGVDSDTNGAPIEQGRMHLTQEMVKELLPLLRRFAQEGALANEGARKEFRVGGWVVGRDPYNYGIEGRIIAVTPGDSILVQDFKTPGVEGQHVTVWDMRDVFWEPTDTPSEIPTWFEHLNQDDL